MFANLTCPKKGFTMIELLVVIGIIGILSAIMLTTVTGTTDSARAAKCLANMHNLANACQATAVADSGGYFPLAGSRETKSMSMNLKTGLKKSVTEGKGWVSWYSEGAYAGSPTESVWQEGWRLSTYEEGREKRLYALTNGAIWKAIGANASSYCCPLHERYAKKNGVSPIWSYVMNSFFACQGEGSGQIFKTLENRDRRLLFAELPFNTDNQDQTCSFSTGSGTELDPTLHYNKENIGFNHKIKKRWYAHVCFLDGHTEKLELPKNGKTQIRELTEWLCEAEDITYDGARYEKAE